MSTELIINFNDPVQFDSLVHKSGLALPSGDVMYLASKPDATEGGQEGFVFAWTVKLPDDGGFALAQFSATESIMRSLAGALQGHFLRKDEADPQIAWKHLHSQLDALFAAYIVAHPDQVEFLDMPFKDFLYWSAEQAGVRS